MNSPIIYNLAEGVQVREERFGLLFYNYRGPRLYFVPTQDLIDAEFFNGHQSADQLVESICTKNNLSRAKIQDQIMQVLGILENKGLIYGQSLC